MSALVGAFIIGLMFIGFILAWMFSGMAAKLLLLWAPPLGIIAVGGSVAYVVAGILGGFILCMAIGCAWATYEKWEYSDTYDRLTKKIDSKFFSE